MKALEQTRSVFFVMTIVYIVVTSFPVDRTTSTSVHHYETLTSKEDDEIQANSSLSLQTDDDGQTYHNRTTLDPTEFIVEEIALTTASSDSQRIETNASNETQATIDTPDISTEIINIDEPNTNTTTQTDDVTARNYTLSQEAADTSLAATNEGQTQTNLAFVTKTITIFDEILEFENNETLLKTPKSINDVTQNSTFNDDVTNVTSTANRNFTANDVINFNVTEAVQSLTTAARSHENRKTTRDFEPDDVTTPQFEEFSEELLFFNSTVFPDHGSGESGDGDVTLALNNVQSSVFVDEELWVTESLTTHPVSNAISVQTTEPPELESNFHTISKSNQAESQTTSEGEATTTRAATHALTDSVVTSEHGVTGISRTRFKSTSPSPYTTKKNIPKGNNKTSVNKLNVHVNSNNNIGKT